MYCHLAQLYSQFCPIPAQQNRADSGMTKITVYPTQVRDHQSHPVVRADFKVQYFPILFPLCPFIRSLTVSQPQNFPDTVHIAYSVIGYSAKSDIVSTLRWYGIPYTNNYWI